MHIEDGPTPRVADGPEPVRLATVRPSDQEEADHIKAAIRAALAPVLAEMTAARGKGFIVQWQLGIDPYGRDTIIDLSLVKRF